jgi:uncharacterized damage-inducible protein DinB
MSVDRSFVEPNRLARERLREVVARLSDDDLQRPLANGWTIATALAHLAFYDRRALVLVDRLPSNGFAPSPTDIDTINDATGFLLRLIPSRLAAEEAVAAAADLDPRLEDLSTDYLEQNLRANRPLRLDRARHRHEHLDEIEAALR